MRIIVYLSVSILLTACNRQEQPEAPTAAESDQLNEAEEMLDNLAEEEGAPTPSSSSEQPTSR